MALNTDFNISPYFDDFDETKNFHRVLFKPSVAVQARELTQLQTILQNQIERFGDNILTEGTIIKGGNFIEENPLAYVKILDSNISGSSVTPSTYVGLKAVGAVTGLEARIVAYEDGLESQTPNLATIYVKYLNTNNSEIKVFNSTENLALYDAADTLIETITVGGESDANPTGNGYGVRCGEGIIYQKGFFIRFSDNIAVVSKYNTYPHEVVIGFEVDEDIINSNEDTSLLDNASGFNNFAAPGADRLKLTPVLVVKTLDEAKADETFFAIQEYALGKVVRRRLTTQYNVIQKMIERRTAEESGNYAVKPYPISVETSSANTSNLNVLIGAGLSYVEGRRVELLNNIGIEIPKATTTNEVTNQDIITTYGNYVVGLANTYSGDFEFETLASVNLLDATANTIGTARLRNVGRDGDNLINFYLFDINVSANSSFDNVRTINYNSGVGTCDLQLENNKAVIKDAAIKPAIWPIGRDFIKQLDPAATSYKYRKANTDVSAAQTTGDFTITLTGGTWGYATGALSTALEREFIIICDQSIDGYVAGQLISDFSVSVTNTTSVTITLDTPPTTGTMDLIVYHNVIKDASISAGNKTLKTVYVRIDTDTHPNTTSGPYSLGMPDLYSLEKVVLKNGSGPTDENDGADVTDYFRAYANATDTHYGLSYVKPKRTYTIAASDHLLIKAKVFQPDSANTFFSVDSYPVDDSTVPLPADKIRTEDIPEHILENGKSVYLRDAIDFRRQVANTAARATTAGTANTNPASTVTFTGDQYFPVNDTAFETNYTYYLGRMDRLYIDEYGEFQIFQGTPAEEPVAPSAPGKGMALALLDIPPFPSLPSVIASRANKSEYGVKIAVQNNKGYTMEAIGKLDRRIRNLEYYTSLTLLEKSAKDLTVLDSTGLDRFKNGILVDNFEDLSIANVRSVEFAASIDPSYKEIQPKFRAYPLDLVITSGEGVTDYGEGVILNNFDIQVIDQPYATNMKSLTTNFYKYAGNMELFPDHDSTPDYVRAPDINFSTDLTKPFADFAEALSEFVPLQRVSEEVVDSNRSTRTNTSTRNLSGGGTATTTTTTITTSDLIERVVDTFQITSDTITEQVGDFVTDVSFNPYLRSREVEIFIGGLRPNTRHYFYFDGVDVNEHVTIGIDDAATPTLTPADPDVYAGTIGNSTNDEDPELFDRTLFPGWSTSLSTPEKSTPSFTRSRKFKRLRKGWRFKRSGIGQEATGQWANNIAIIVDGSIQVLDTNSPIATYASGSVNLSTIANFPLTSNIIKSDSNGELRAIFRIPEGTFFAGDRTLEVFDVPSYANKDVSTSYASKTYRGFNISVTKSALSTSTRVPDFEIDTAISSRTEITQTRSSRTRITRPPANDGGRDPLAQTFIIDADQSEDHSIFLSRLDLYFAKKSTTNGIIVEIRETDNGYPGGATVPFSRVHLTPAQVTTSLTSAETPTAIVFQTPVAIKTGVEYAIVIRPCGNDPDYLVWISRVGGTDVDTGEAITQDTNAGVLFTSTNNRAWTPYQDENLKFTLHKKQFTNNYGFIKLSNPDNEFLELSGVSTTAFVEGELVFAWSNTSYETGTVSTTAGNTIISGSGTSFTTAYAAGEYIVLEPQPGLYQVLEIASVTNNTSMVCHDIPFDTTASSLHYKTVAGVCQQYIDRDPKTLVLVNSSAKTGLVFSNTDIVMGEESGASASVSEVKNQPVTFIQPNIFRSEFTKTRTALKATKLHNGSTTYTKNFRFGDNNYLSDATTYIKSRSNEITDDAGAKSFELQVDLTSTAEFTRDTSPYVDHYLSNVTAYENIINNDSTFEVGPDGNASAKYISKKVELADGLDAGDIKVWLTAYRPPSTDIEVYVKMKSAADSGTFDDSDEVAWTQATMNPATSAYSSSANRFDYREFEFSLGTTALAAGAGAWVDQYGDNFQYIDNNDAIYYDFKYFAVKIVMLSTGHHRIPRIKDMRAIALT